MDRNSYIFLKRKAVIKTVAEGLCRAFSMHAQRAYAVESAFVFNDQSPAFDEYVDKYYQEIDKFKQNHEMSKLQIANRCKRAAAFILVSEDRSLLSSLFFIKILPRADFIELFYAHFTYSLCCAFLELDRRKVPEDAENHFIYNILKERGNASFACLTLMMRAFADAYGKKVEPAFGDDEA